MSTTYEIRGKSKISFKRLRNDIGQGKLPGLTLHKEDQTKSKAAITDGQYFVWLTDEGDRAEFDRFGPNDVSNILNKIAKHYNIRIVSEHGDEEFPCDDDEIEEKQRRTKALLLSAIPKFRPNPPRKMEK